MNIKNIENTSDRVSWLNFKGYDIRLEKSKEFTQGNLTITVTPKGYDNGQKIQKKEINFGKRDGMYITQ